jgi:molybdopterin converting factor small subunit
VTEAQTVTVLFFAAARDAAGTAELLLPVSGAGTLAELQQRVLQQLAGLQRMQSMLLWAVNNQYAVPAMTIGPGDTVACFPPVSGG